MSTIYIYVEDGAPKNKQLNIDCRMGFKLFFTKYGIPSNKIRIIPSGSRGAAFKNFCTAINNATDTDNVILLIDSEAPVASTNRYKPWDHLQTRTGDQHWQKPQNADDDSAHFMTQCMESWFIADKQELKKYYGNKFKEQSLPRNTDIEQISKQQLFDSLKKATRETQKGEYSKGNHSFKILARVGPVKIKDQSCWADRLLEHIKSLST